MTICGIILCQAVTDPENVYFFLGGRGAETIYVAKGHQRPVPDGQPVKSGTCAHDRRALQQPALNVHVKHSDLT